MATAATHLRRRRPHRWQPTAASAAPPPRPAPGPARAAPQQPASAPPPPPPRRWRWRRRGRLFSVHVVVFVDCTSSSSGRGREAGGGAGGRVQRADEANGGELATSSSSRLLFRALKLALPALRDSGGDRAPARALVVAASLADLQMDAEVISAGILREALDAGAISMRDVKSQIGISIAHLLHESLRLKHVPSKLDVVDDESASALRKFCLSYYDIRAVILELVLKLDMMRHLDCLPRYLQRTKSLEVLKIYAPLAHAVGAGSQETENKLLIDSYKEQLLKALKDDDELSQIVQGISIQGRYKSRFSTMKKLSLNASGTSSNWGPRACHRTHEIIQSLWKEVPGRTKDYITQPKGNGYQSLHVSIDVSEPGKMRPLMEIQIRTKEMHKFAVGGEASHSLYKGGLTDPGEESYM
ncbi:hypothetical protein GUJ93_ZPchr0244g6584 [Zizania palustris]|uniref:GTP diphosphokinase n=1 Tax=Zizania palustris TaxID=103762 RepID=A0A8J5RK04_ZIZPA|nr:hypothetical protein GUJ93_ZPchr0244g6584 [Zizania palustris]